MILRIQLQTRSHSVDRLQRFENNRDRRKPSFSWPAPRKLHDQLPHDDFAQEFDRYIPVAAARFGRRGGASPSNRRVGP